MTVLSNGHIIPPALVVRREGNVFTGVRLSGHMGGGGGYPSPRFFPRSLVPGHFWEGTPVPGSFPGLLSHVLSRGPQSCWGGGGGGTPVLTGQYPSPRQEGQYPVPGRRYPSPGQGVPRSPASVGYPKIGVPPQDRTGVPPHLPDIEQQSEYLLPGRRYASCGHTGGLLC